MSGEGDLGRPDRITADGAGKAIIEAGQAGKGYLRPLAVADGKRRRRRCLFQEFLPVRLVAAKGGVEEAPEIVPVVFVQVEEDLPEEGIAFGQVEAQGRRGGNSAALRTLPQIRRVRSRETSIASRAVKEILDRALP